MFRFSNLCRNPLVAASVYLFLRLSPPLSHITIPLFFFFEVWSLLDCAPFGPLVYRIPPLLSFFFRARSPFFNDTVACLRFFSFMSMLFFNASFPPFTARCRTFLLFETLSSFFRRLSIYRVFVAGFDHGGFFCGWMDRHLYSRAAPYPHVN